MTAGTRDRFDVDALERSCDPRAFARGQAYFREGRVELLDITAERVLAVVTGTDAYRVVLRGQGRQAGGSCTCIAFADFGFCKHLFATELATNAAAQNHPAATARDRIREHLNARSKDALVAMLVDLAEEDIGLFRRLLLAAALDGDDDEAVEARLRSELAHAVPEDPYAFDAAERLSAGVRPVLDAAQDLAKGPRAALAMRISALAVQAVEEIADEVDDVDGEVEDLLERAAGIHLAACQAAKPDPVALAAELFALQSRDAPGTFRDAVERYADILGEDGLAAFRRLAMEAWSHLPPAGEDEDPSEAVEDALAEILDFFGERDGDVDARIAVRRRLLLRTGDYLDLARFCHEEGRDEDALRYAEEGLRHHGSSWQRQPLMFLQVEILVACGKQGEALERLWSEWERSPGQELYQRLRDLGGSVAGDRAREGLRDRVAAASAASRSGPLHLLISLLTQEARYEEAWALVRTYGGSPSVREALASESAAWHPVEALQVFEERVEELAAAGGDRNYQAAATLVARMAELRRPAAQEAYLITLRQRHGRKRNLMKLLS